LQPGGHRFDPGQLHQDSARVRGALMATVEYAHRIVRIGQRVYIVGGLLGAGAWLWAFSGDLHRIIVFLLPIWIGLLISFVGKKQERLAQQPDVGRQM
jgi:hypothetical protein